MQDKDFEIAGNKLNRLAQAGISLSAIDAREQAIQSQRADLDKRERDYAKRLKDVEEDFAKRSNIIERRDAELRKQRERDDQIRDEVERERLAFQERSKKETADLAAQRAELEAEKIRYLEETKKQIQQKSEKYVRHALEVLGQKEVLFHTYSARWAGAGALSILGAFGIAAWATFQFIPDPHASLSWQYLSFISIRGLILVGLSLALARYSLLFSERYIKEALKNAERRHAIQFGAFYLDSYGAAADWNQVKEAFKHWNISLANGVDSSKVDEKDVEPHVISEVLEQLRNIASSLSSVVKK